MEGTDVSTGKDTSYTNDHTYYGNGCPNGWNSNPPYYGGSTVSCETRLVETADNEYQKNGTYYHFQAASVGSGAAINTDNTNSPDTFCPLGWQMPYSGTDGDYYDQSRSWKYLLESYNIINNVAGFTKLQSFPLSFIPSGSYDFFAGVLYHQETNGLFTSLTVKNLQSRYRLNFYSSGIRYNEINSKLNGYTVRCSLILATLKSNPNSKLAENNKVF